MPVVTLVCTFLQTSADLDQSFLPLLFTYCGYNSPLVALIRIILINSKTSHFTWASSLCFPRHRLSVQSLNYSTESGCCSYVILKPPHVFGLNFAHHLSFSLSHCCLYQFCNFSFGNIFLCFNSFTLFLFFFF